ncbi:MAG: hypothetical protein KTR30_34260, partial [Saprospiraceae bacterium]|nr:hypothetical protein [Saprospiraceae bacterium]
MKNTNTRILDPFSLFMGGQPNRISNFIVHWKSREFVLHKAPRRFALSFVILYFFSISSFAQDGEVVFTPLFGTEMNDDGNNHTTYASNSYKDFYIPPNTPYNAIFFRVRGADGGYAQAGDDCKSWGGDGATAEVTILIGDGEGQLPRGSYVRFIVGEVGSNGKTGGTKYTVGGGGGGTAVLFNRDGQDDNWDILAVGGGGGGAFQGNVFGECTDSQAGQGGRATTQGGNGAGGSAGNGGSNGNGGDGGGTIGSGDLAGGGGGAFSPGKGLYNKEGQAGFPAGGTGGDGEYGLRGGWGFGGGGLGEDAGGGGGGYSGGGGGGNVNNGGGGGSYANPNYTYGTNITEGSRNSGTNAGYVLYNFKNLCSADISGFTYINPLCAAGDQGRIQLEYALRGGNNCDSQLEWSLEPINGWNHLGNGLFRSMRAGTYTAFVKNTSINAVVQTYTFTVGVTNEAPKAVCKNITVDLTNGTYSNTGLANLIDGGSTGPCDPVLTASKTSFDCNDLGNNTVTLTSTGSHNLSSSCQANVRVQLSSSEQAVAKCKESPSFNLDEGTVVLSADDIDNGSSLGGCPTGMSISPSTFNCTMLGENIVTLTVGSGQNVASCSSTIIITDNNTPTANCKSTASAILVDGSVSIDYTVIDNGSLSNNCTQLSYDISQSDFDCSHVGTNEVTLTVTDDRNNQSNCTTTVNVIDNTNPVAVCQDVEVALDENGSYILDPTELDGGSTDHCNLTFTASRTTFDCEDIGVQDITLTATDQEGNESSCTGQVTVVDNIAPVIAQCQDLTVQLRGAAGSFSIVIYKSVYFQHASDNCELASIAFIGATTLTCEDIGVNERGLEAIDGSGNRTVCNFNVTVQDDTEPEVLCQDITAQLDADGNASITTADIDNGSNDVCGITSLNLDKTDFSCDDLGNNTVMLTATDESGNTSSCQATVTVVGELAPNTLCQDITVQLDETGHATISTAAIDNGSNDACGIASLNLDKTDFSCDDLGNNTVTLTATGGNGNTSSCQATVTVVDELAPNVLCQDITVQLDEAGEVTITPEQIAGTSTDNCGPLSFKIEEGLTSFDCDRVGNTYSLRLEITDAANNSKRCNASVTVTDPNSYCNQAPIAVCQDITVEVGEDCQVAINAIQIDGGSTDPDGDQISFSLDQTGPLELGTHVVTLIIDDGDLASSCTATVTVKDVTTPTISCPQAMTVSTDQSECGSYVNLPKLVASDNCGIPILLSRYRPIADNEEWDPLGDFSAWASDHSGFFEPGFYEIQWRATDQSDNNSYCVFTLR